MSIIDTPFNTESKASCLVANGVKTVIRYYNFSNSSTFKSKRLELAEAQVLSAHGLKMAVTFQQRQNQVGDFSDAKGEAAGRRAYRYAQDHIGQPAGSGIYFSVDFDASKTELANHIEPYFNGVKRGFDAESGGNPEYRIGAYGSGLVCSVLTGKGLIELTWLAMSRGFRGTKDALNNGEYHLAQNAPEAHLCGLGVDFNDTNPAKPDFGEFSIDFDTVVPSPIIAIGYRYKVIARNGLNLRGGPGTQFNTLGSLRANQMVFVKSITNGWAAIDLEGDGLIDGFSSIDFLKPV